MEHTDKSQDETPDMNADQSSANEQTMDTTANQPEVTVDATPEVAAPVPAEVPVYTQPVSASQFEATAAAASSKQNFWRRWTEQTRAYLAEYAVLLIALGSMISLVNSLFAGIINNFAEEKHAWYWQGGWTYKVSIAELAAVVALVPILVLLTKRTGSTEETAPLVKSSNWRKAFLGVFLIGLGLTAVGYAIGFIYVIVSALANFGLAVDTDQKMWQALVKDGFGVILFGCSALLYARDYRETNEGNLLMWRRVHRYALVLLAVVTSVLFIALPLQKQRGAYVDELVVGDLNVITSKVSDYASKNRKLPTSLDNLDLAKEVKTRVKSQKYEYKPGNGNSYELCATFSTDASSKDKNPIIADIYAGTGSGASLNQNTSESPSTHEKGHQCFKQTAYGVSTRFSSPSYPSTPKSKVAPDDTYDDTNYNDYQDF